MTLRKKYNEYLIVHVLFFHLLDRFRLPFAVMSFRISLSSLSSSAISPARSGSSAKSILSATFALFNRPPAFKQGPITKPIWYALKFSISRLFFL